jgi:hypothetical protein
VFEHLLVLCELELQMVRTSYLPDYGVVIDKLLNILF